MHNNTFHSLYHVSHDFGTRADKMWTAPQLEIFVKAISLSLDQRSKDEHLLPPIKLAKVLKEKHNETCESLQT